MTFTATLLRLAGLLLVAAALAIALVDTSIVVARPIEKRLAPLTADEMKQHAWPHQIDPIRAATLGR